jgi:hypothetical protein
MVRSRDFPVQMFLAEKGEKKQETTKEVIGYTYRLMVLANINCL